MLGLQQTLNYNCLAILPRLIILNCNFMHLDELPEDLLVVIFQHCQINDVFALRLVNRCSNNVLTNYAKTILPLVAHETIPDLGYELLYWQAGKQYSLNWLKGLIPRYLATALLDGPSFRAFKSLGWSSIASWDPLGNELRSRLENGWCVLKKLSNISQTVYSPPMQRMANAFNQQTWSHIQSSLHNRLALGKGRLAQDFSFISQKEQMIASRRNAYVKDVMTQSDAVDYMLLTRLLSRCLRYHPRIRADGTSTLSAVNKQWISKQTKPDYSWPGKYPGTYYWFADWQVDTPCPIAIWLLWAILHLGPDPFFRQWTSGYDEGDPAVDYVSAQALALWEGQDMRATKLRAQLARELDLAIRRRCLKPRKEKDKRREDHALDEAMQLGTMDHKLFIREALLAEYFMQWRALGGENMQVDLSEAEERAEDEMIARGRHPRERVPFFVYLGKEAVEAPTG